MESHDTAHCARGGPERGIAMSYKTILVHVDESSAASERARLAAAIAMAQDAHLIGTAVTGVSRYLAQTRMLADLDAHLRAQLDFVRERAQRGLTDFGAVAQKAGLSSFEKRLVDDEAGAGICVQARYADLVVIGQTDPNEFSPVTMTDFPQYVVLNSGRPVLLVPYGGHFGTIGRHALVAWNGSIEATRAVSSALPLLRQAARVDVIVFAPATRLDQHGLQSGADLSAYLARHAVRVNLLSRDTGDAGNALLLLARDLECDLIVMGGYGHHRFREILLGGVTSHVLEAMGVPVLMAH